MWRKQGIKTNQCARQQGWCVPCLSLFHSPLWPSAEYSGWWRWKILLVLKIKVRDKIVADGDPWSFLQHGEQRQVCECRPDGTTCCRTGIPSWSIGATITNTKWGILKSDWNTQRYLPGTTAHGGGYDEGQQRQEHHHVLHRRHPLRVKKASAYMLHNGFKMWFHPEGVSLTMHARRGKQGLPSKFIGKNFVFDDRLGADHGRHHRPMPPVRQTRRYPYKLQERCCHLLLFNAKYAQKPTTAAAAKNAKQYTTPEDEEQKALRKGIDKGDDGIQ